MPDDPNSPARWIASIVWPPSSAAEPSPGETRQYVPSPSAAELRHLFPRRIRAARAVAQRRSDDRRRSRQLIDGLGAAALIGRAAIDHRRRLTIGGDPANDLIAALRAGVDHSIRDAIVWCGPPRANQKPVLQLHDVWGRTVAYAKVAWNDLTHGLIAREHGALTRLAAETPRGVEVPRVLATGAIEGITWLALSPITVRRRVADEHQAVARAIEDVGDRWQGRFADSAFAGRLQDQVRSLPVAGKLVEELLRRDGDEEVRLGAWHGDFVPWNLLSGRFSTAVWDWERFDPAVPLGFDRIHFAIQVSLHRRGRSEQQAVEALRGALAQVVPELDATVAARHLDWYLAEIVARYEADAITTVADGLAARVHALADTVDHSWSPA